MSSISLPTVWRQCLMPSEVSKGSTDQRSPMTAAEFCRAALFFHHDKADDFVLSLGHWVTPEPDPQKMTATTLPRFYADMSVTVGELRRMSNG
jgi:hypothetical protein